MSIPAGRRLTLLERVDRWSLFMATLSVTWFALLVRVPFRINQDAWLALVAGREVAERGLPHHDRLGTLTQGVRWVDQQWLSQLGIFEVHRVGGLAFYAILAVGLAVAAVALAISAARHLGAADLHIVAVLLVPCALFVAASGEIRTQAFAYPLFVLVLWLLSSEARAPTRRAYFLLPILALWANLHGSVTLGVGLGCLFGISMIVQRPAADSQGRPWRRGLIFVLGAPLCLLATPYGLSGITYYSDTLLNPTFREVVSEWRPVTAVLPLAVLFFLVAFAAAWLLGRGGRRHNLFEHLALYLTIAAGISSVRNVTWFGLTAIVLLPGLVSTTFGPPEDKPRHRTVNLALAGTSLVLLLAGVVTVALQPRSWFEQGYDSRAAAVVARATQDDPSLKVYAGDRFADWLLWREPQLAGRVAYDTRLELLTDDQIHQLADFLSEKGRDPGRIAQGFGLLVLDPKRLQDFTRHQLQEPGTTVLYRGHDVIVARRPQR